MAFSGIRVESCSPDGFLRCAAEVKKEGIEGRVGKVAEADDWCEFATQVASLLLEAKHSDGRVHGGSKIKNRKEQDSTAKGPVHLPSPPHEVHAVIGLVNLMWEAHADRRPGGEEKGELLLSRLRTSLLLTCRLPMRVFKSKSARCAYRADMKTTDVFCMKAIRSFFVDLVSLRPDLEDRVLEVIPSLYRLSRSEVARIREVALSLRDVSY